MPAKTLDNVKPLGELNPDFVLSVKYTVDEKGIPLENSDGKFATLIKTLIKAGFYSQVRPGEDSTLLVFIKLNDSTLLKALKSFHLKDYLYGVNNSIDDDEQILEKLTTAEKLRTGYSIITDPEFEGGAGITAGSGQWEFVDKIIPLHDYELNKKLLDTWLKKPLIDENDIATIKDIAGERVALYFGFVRFYTVWLVVPSVLGFLSYFFFKRYSAIFTFLNLFWAILFTNSWKKKENIYSITWNTKDSSLIEPKRSEFVGEVEELDNVTGIKSPKFPSYKRSLRQLAFIPIALTFALVLLSYQFGCFFIEIFLNEIYQGSGKIFLSLVPTVLIVAFIPIITAVYTIFVDKFVAWENHETQTTHDRSVIQKQFVLNFLASYVPLIITSFVYLPFGHLVNPYLSFIYGYTNRYNITINQSHFEINKDRLNQQFAYFAVTNQVVGFFVENIVPVVIRKVTEHFRKSKEQNAAVALTDLPEEAEFLEQVRKQVTLPPFNVDDEYRELTIQFGYLALFGPVWSLSPIVSLISNWVEFRGDAYKLFNEAARPIPHKADSIDPWNKNLRGLTWFATLVAPAVTALFRQSDLYDVDSFSHLKSPVRLQPWTLLAIVLFSEHLLVALNFIVESVYGKITSEKEAQYESNLYKTRRQYIEGYLQQTGGASNGVSKRSVPIDPTETYWENFSDEEVVKHAGIIPKQVLDAIAFKREKEEAEKQEAKVLAEKKKAEAQQSKQFEQEKVQNEKLASHSAYQSYPEDSASNLQSRSNRSAQVPSQVPAQEPVDSTTASKGVPATSVPYASNTQPSTQGNGHGVGVAAATAAAVGGGSALAAGQGGQQAGQEGLSKGFDAYTSHPSQTGAPTGSQAGPQTGATGGNVPQINVNDASTGSGSGSAPQTSQGYPAEYGTAGTSKIPSDVSSTQRSLDPAANKGSSSSGSNAGTAAGIGAGAGLAGAGAATGSGSGSSSSKRASGVPAGATSTSGKSAVSNDAVSENSATSAPSTKSSNRKSGFFSKFTKKDASSIAKAAKEDGSKHLAEGKNIAGDLKKGDLSSTKKLANDVKSNPDEYIGNTKKALNSSDYKSGSGAASGSDAGTGAGASSSGANAQGPESSSSGYGKAAGVGAGAGLAGAGIAASSGHGSEKSSSAPQPNIGSRQAAAETPSGPKGDDVYASQPTSSRVDPQGDNVNPYNAVPKDTQQSSSANPSTTSGSQSHGKEAAGLGAAGVGASAASGSGSGSKSTATEAPKEEKKGGFLSKFTKKDASSIGKAAKEDGTKHFAEGKNIAGDLKKGDYSSAQKFAGDVKSNPDEYIGNTKNAFNSSDYKSSGKGASAAGAGTGAATGAGVGTAGASGKSSGSDPTGSSTSGQYGSSTTRDSDALENARGPGDASAATQNAHGPSSSSSGHGKSAAIGAGAGAGAAGLGASAASGSESGSTATEAPEDTKKGGFLSKFSKNDASSLGNAVKDDGTKHFAEGKNIAGDLKKGDYSSAQKFAGDVKKNPDEYIGNTKNAFNSSDYKSSGKGASSAGAGTGAATGAGVGAAGASGTSSRSAPTDSSATGSSTSGPYGSSATRDSDALENARGPGDAPLAAQNAQGPDSFSSGYGKAAGIGAGAAAAGAGIAGLAGRGSNGADTTNASQPTTAGSATGQPSTSGTTAPSSSAGYQGDDVSGLSSKTRDVPQSDSAYGSTSSTTEAPKEEKKGGLFSFFNKKDATSIAQAAKEDGTKLASEGKNVFEDVKKGDYSSAKKLASDIKDSPDQYIGNTKQAFQQSGQGEHGAATGATTGSTGAPAQDYTHGASQVPSDSTSSGHGISGKQAATGAGVAGAGAAGAAYATRDHDSTSAHPQSSSSATQPPVSGYDSTSKSTGPSGSGVPTSPGAAGATLPPNYGTSGSQNKSTAGTSSSNSAYGSSSTGYTGTNSDVFANQPDQALRNSDAKGYTSSQAAQQGSSGKSHGHSGAATGAATGAGIGAGAAYAGKSSSGSSSSKPDYSASGVHADNSTGSRFTDQGSASNPPSSQYVSQGSASNPPSSQYVSHGSASNAGKSSTSSGNAPSDLAGSNRNPFVTGEATSQSNKPTADDGAPTLDPKSAGHVKSTDASFKPSKVPATEESHPTSLGGAEKEHANQGGFGLGGIAGAVAGAAGAAGLSNKFGGHGGETKEGSIPSGGQNVSSNLASDGERATQGGGYNAYLEKAKGYGEKYGSQFNDYVQQGAHKVDEYAKNSDNEYITKGNVYVQKAAEKSDEYAKQQAERETKEGISGGSKDATDPTGSAGAAATKPSSGGATTGAATGATAGATAGGLSASNAGPNADKKSSTSGASQKSSKSAYNQFSKEHTKSQEKNEIEPSSGSLPQHFQYENKNPYTGQTGPVPGTEDKVLDTDGNPTTSDNAVRSKPAKQYGDELAPPKTTNDVESASSQSSPRKKKSFLSSLKNKVKGSPSPNSSTQTSPKKTTA
ncbi:Anoctamin-5 [Wickerhamomyces ciferrii]|uniref:Anoctamin-5 n=1 Tax=Wickerhamomyces ciferrii (strain ATCC 14091 / BCRC 22168 / CBS 111 / JCM 3599 / NBRC 0793 / NRRL Y-1031 F-60-10) TaxID=1206466 RepID=K0KUD5_WICCF|nr:Anoctamin-5 [Wickerhamomyces ciferrii]CCH44808.1 Anoctamin-5 [Wickerhamomyces ciferrii]